MKLNDCIKRIERYLQGSDTRPRLVNVRNVSDLTWLKQHFQVGKNRFLSMADFSKKDELASLDSLIDILQAEKEPTFITELTTGLKIQGDIAIRQMISNVANFSKLNCHTILFCYQCEEILSFSDKRLREIVYLVEGSETPKPNIVILSKEISPPTSSTVINGVDQIATVIEKYCGDQSLYVRTHKTIATFALSLYTVSEANDAYDALCQIDPHTVSLRRELGTVQEWINALNFISKYDSWASAISALFGNPSHLNHHISNWRTLTTHERWMYFIALKLFGAGNNVCLREAVQQADSQEKLLKEVYRSLLNLDHATEKFWERYGERKNLIEIMGASIEEVIDYCNMVRSKNRNALYYLTDSSQFEREQIIETLHEYGEELGREEVITALSHVYPDLYAYLLPYRFKHEILNVYFQTYKYAKIINKVLPELEVLVEDQAIKREYNLLLTPRTKATDSIPREESLLYYIDAMGVEFLGYIMEKCRQKKLIASINVCRCELPSITLFNKEFLEGFSPESVISVKEIDEIKHKGKENYDYRKTKLPLHLIRELDIIDDILEKIRVSLAQNPSIRVFMVSDHGATRMAVIKENTLDIDVNSKGTHGGRVCELTEAISRIPYATKAGEYYVLANYARFKGGRAASVETHGGATLEEVAVPVIEINAYPVGVEIIILTPQITVSFRKKTEIKLFSKTMLENVSVCVEGMFYNTETIDGQNFIVQMHNLKQAKQYSLDVYINDNLIQKNLYFTIEKESAREIDLL